MKKIVLPHMPQNRNLNNATDIVDHSKDKASLKKRMNKGNTVKIILFVIFMLQVLSIHAVQIIVNGVTYDDFAGSGMSTVHDGKYIHVSVVSTNSNVTGNLVIPELLGDIQAAGFTFTLRVTAVANSAFTNNTKITSITFPNTVTTIGNNAFSGCSNLTSITFGTGLTSIEPWIFDNCPSLSSLNVAEGNTAYSSLNGVLYNKDYTELMKYPVGKSDNSFSVPNTVIAIADEAFMESKLSSIILPESLKTIGDWAFGNCSNLSSISIPRNVTDISTKAFNLCTGLINFQVAEENTAYSVLDGVLYNKNKTTIVRYPPNKANDSFLIPTTVTEVAGYAFRDCQQLPSVFVSGNVTSIGHGAFAWNKIKSITLSKSVNYIDIYAFSDCPDLTELTVLWDTPSEVTINNGEYSFENIFAEINKSAVTLHVLPGTKNAYLANDNWKDFNIVEDAKGAGLKDMSLLHLNVYPNPTSDSFFVDYAGFIQVKIYDMFGKEVLTQNVNDKTEVNIKHLPKGIYNVSVFSEGKVIGNSKIIKQ